MSRFLILFAVFVVVFAPSLRAASLDRIGNTGTLRIGFREDAQPFSYKDAIGEPAGYSVDLCRAVATSIKDQLRLDEISINYIPVSAENRFQRVQNGDVDLLCGATTVTLSRREKVDFSLQTFIDGASVLYRTEGPKNFGSLAGHKVGVRAGTTTEEALNNTLKQHEIDAEVVPVSDHGNGLAMLEANEISAYFADQAILLFLLTQSGDPSKLRLSNRFFTHEPYALAMQRGDSEFRLAVDRALSRIYRSKAIERIFKNNFGSATPGDVVKALYVINALPE